MRTTDISEIQEKMKTVTLLSLNNRGYYSPALYLLRNYALRDAAICSGYRFELIDAPILFSGRRRGYSITVAERIMEFLRFARARKLGLWIKTQAKYSRHLVYLLTALMWWWTFFRLLATRPDVIGFSCYIWNVEHMLRMMRWVKRVFPGTVIIAGGQEVTNSAEEFIREYPYIDFVVDGEGEDTFSAALRLLLNGDKRDIKSVPGLMGRHDKTCEKRRPIKNLAIVSAPFTSYEADSKMLRKVGRSSLGYMVETSRGCPFKCSFCFESDKFKSVRYFPIEKIADEIMGMRFFGIMEFHILDPVLCNSDNARLRALAGIIRQANGIVRINLSVEVYAELLKDEMTDSLDVFTHFDVGLQSYNPHVLKRINRYFNEGKFTQGIEILKKAKKGFAVYLIYGLPGETFFSFIKSLRYVISLRPPDIFINQLCVLRGTPLKRDVSKEKLDYNPAPPYLIRSTSRMSKEDVVRCVNLSSSLTKEFKAMALEIKKCSDTVS